MNTQLLHYAVEIEKTGSITKAAQNLFMAQPNLSKALKELEEHLGYAIFERTFNGMIPTERGYGFLLHAKRIMDHISQIEALSENKEPRTQQFHISIPRGSYIAEAFTEFVAELDPQLGMDVMIQETNSMQAINNVAYENFNLGIIRYQSIYENYFVDFIKSKGLQQEVVWKFEYLLVMADNHPLAGKGSLKGEDLFPYIELSHSDLVIPYVDRKSMNLQEHNEVEGKHIYVFDRGCQFDLLARVPNTYMWVSPLPELYLKQYGLVQRKCSIPNNSYKDVLIYREGYQPGKMDEKFKEKLCRARDEVAYEVR
ncbi:LysR family transcriptional regulator [Kineothrix sp. MB12-C1]|uniref:LysR family transcriptional regulator n=1 Tax=Kineothrix sp. MB12-C1 TaxID=3070215 RepID=UPI0027D21490|nr:LysR family transcriptional regulator [Kineothrix sp. MB12-C1]WMC94220.1 LysR family transcriptional regulator [Kineothrix sp. MB12-C1]